MTFSFYIPTTPSLGTLGFESGSSIIFVGANGAGKTRLAVAIENGLGEIAHRISAHRALTLNPQVTKINEDVALCGLRYGVDAKNITVTNRENSRWRQRAAVHLLNDFDYLLQALFAEQRNTSLKTHMAARSGVLNTVVATKFEELKQIWERLLPNRTLLFTGDDINIITDGDEYSAAEMSDGERAVFYMLGQALMAPTNAALIIDEPELHIHPSILGKLWDEIQAAREDCGFIFITHDLQFAANRLGAKFVVKSYKHGQTWNIEKVPEDTGFDEATLTLILGSRRPILFVEGRGSSLDFAIFRACFDDWTVIPRGSCEEVIHSVVTMRRNAALTRVTCAGLVDADDYTEEEAAAMMEKGIGVLPVSEIENLFLLPSISMVIAKSEGFKDEALDKKLSELYENLIELGSSAVERTVMQHCRRRIDRALKRIDLSSSSDPDQLSIDYRERTEAIGIVELAKEAKNKIETALNDKNVPVILKYFDGKGSFMAAAAKHLKSTKRENFEEWIVRALRNNTVPDLTTAIRQSLPIIVAS